MNGSTDIDEDGGGPVELRSTCTRSLEVKSHLLIAIADGLSKVQVETLSDYNHRRAHWLHSERRIADTCNWIMGLVEFKEWVTGTGPPVLVCVGSRQ